MEKIDWDNIPEGFDWVAIDESGDMYGYESKPFPDEKDRVWEGSDSLNVHYVKRLGYEAWLESLQQRPPKEPEIKFGKGTNEEWGPRPEKLWVGMRGVNGYGDMLTVKSIDGKDHTAYCSRVEWAKGEIGEVGYLSYCTAYTGKYWGDVNKWAAAEDIVEWEQPQESQSEPDRLAPNDWKAKYAELYLMHMEKIDECTMLREWREESESAPDWKAKYEQLQQEVANMIDCRVPYAELRRKYLRLKAELEQTQAELNDAYKDREKLNKIVEIIHGTEYEE